MANFKFSLAQVLRYREQLEDQAKMELAQRIADHAASVERQKEIEAQILEVEKTLFHGETAIALTDAERWLHTNYHTCLKNDALAQAARTEECEQAVSQARAKLVQAAQDRQLLDKMKQKQLERHSHEEKLREQRELDEITTTRRPVPAF